MITVNAREMASKQDNYDVLTFVSCSIFAIALIAWFVINHGYPAWDAANHTLAANDYADLLHKARPFNVNWLSRFLTVDPAYPLTINLLYGTFRAVFGLNNLADGLCAASLLTVLNLSTAGIARHLHFSKLTSCISIVVLNTFPLVCGLSHTLLLDFGVLALVALAYWRMLAWSDEPDNKNLALFSLALAMAVTSKQAASFYFVAPMLILLILALRAKNFKKVIHLLTAGLAASAALALWVIPNYSVIKRIKEVCQAEVLTGGNYWSQVEHHVEAYLQGYIQIVSPLWAIISLLAAFAAFRQARRLNLQLPTINNKRVIFASGIAGGIIMLSLMAVSRPETRYVIPLALPGALLGAGFIAHLLAGKSSDYSTRLSGIALLALALAQYLIFNFAPYPLTLSRHIADDIKAKIMQENPETLIGIPSNPTPPGDIWGQHWLLQEGASYFASPAPRAARLNLLVNTDALNVHTLTVAARQSKIAVDISTCRRFTLNGDEIALGPQELGYFDIFVVKSGRDTGYKTAGQQSDARLAEAKAKLAAAGFNISRKTLSADNSELILYKKPL
jgi:4-amino-4-deoxy-L-arabinose transferase-like glycosyltransferase